MMILGFAGLGFWPGAEAINLARPFPDGTRYEERRGHFVLVSLVCIETPLG